MQILFTKLESSFNCFSIHDSFLWRYYQSILNTITVEPRYNEPGYKEVPARYNEVHSLIPQNYSNLYDMGT